MDYKSMLENFAKESGREGLYPYTFGVIRGILTDNSYGDDKKVAESKKVMEVMNKVCDDKTLPWFAPETKIASAPTEAEKKIYQPQCNTDSSKIEPFLDRRMAEDLLRWGG